MPYEFKLPDLGEGLTEGEIARWLVQEGQEIAEDDPLVEVQTDKTTVEIPSPAAGKVASIFVEEGKVVPVGTVLVVIDDGAVPQAEEQPRAEPAPPLQPPTSTEPSRLRATPLIRKIAQDLGVDLADVDATGPQGRITEEDVRRAAAGPAEGRREPVRGVRRLIAEHMARAHRAEGDGRRAAGVPGAERAAGGGRDRLPRPLRPRRRGADRPGARRPGRAGRRHTIDGGAGRGGAPPGGGRQKRLAGGGGAARLDLHAHERGEARRAVPDADREPSGGRDPQPRPDRRPPGRPRRRDRREARRLCGAHVRPPRGRRRPGGGVRARRSPPPRGACRVWLVLAVVVLLAVLATGQLAADLALGVLRSRVHVGINGTGANRADYFGERAGLDALVGGAEHVGRDDVAFEPTVR